MNVKKEFTQLENSSVKLTVTIAQKDVAQNYSDLVADYAKKIQIPGFRRGKVPVAILERKYGEALTADVASDLIEKAIKEIFDDEKLEYTPLPYAQPSLAEEPKLDITKDLTFAVTFDIMPKVNVKGIDTISIEVPQASVGEEDLQDELKAIQERNALVIDKKDTDKAKKDDIATINYCELDDSNKVISGSERQDYVFTIGSKQNIYEIDDDLLGMKKNESKEITKTFSETFANPDLAGKTKKIKITLTALKVKDLPALDDDLAQDVNEKYKTLDDLKADLKKNLEKTLEKKLEEIQAAELLNKLVALNEITLPKSMIDAQLESRWIMMARQFQTNPEQLEKIFSSTEKNKEAVLKDWEEETKKMLKSRIIVDSLLKEANISVSDKEFDGELEKIAANASISIDEVKKHYATEQEKTYLIDDLKEKKLFDDLFKKITIKKSGKKTFKDLFKQE